MINSIARILSSVLHPMMTPIYLLYFIFMEGSIFSRMPIETKIYSFILTIVVFLFIPLISLPILKHIGLIKTYKLENKRERMFLISIVFVSALLGFCLLTRLAYSNIVGYMYIALIMSLLGSYMTSYFQKTGVSLHMTAMGVICGFLFILGYKYFGDVRGSLILMLFLTGLLASSQLYLKKHTPFQVYQGFLMGLCITSGALF